VEVNDVHKGLWPAIGLGAVVFLVFGAVIIYALPAAGREELRNSINFGNPLLLLLIVLGVAVVLFAWLENRGK